MAGLARHHARQRDALLAAERRFLEGEIEIVTEVVAAARSALAARRPRTPEEVAEDAAEDVFETSAEVEPATALERRRAETIVLCATLGVAEDLVGGRRFLEALFGLFVAGVAIRMLLERHLPIGALQLLLARLASDAEHLIEVTQLRRHPHVYTHFPFFLPSTRRPRA
jgi:hypothetical protein